MEYINPNNKYTGKIIDILRKHPEGLSITDIAKLLQVHRHTITKYIYQLMGAGVIYQRKVGPTKLCYLRENYSGGSEVVK